MNSSAATPGPLTRVALGLLRSYQVVRAGRPSPCRFEPSCSSYAMEAVTIHGAGRGSWLALRRVARCHPFGGHGWDPVPPAGEGRRQPRTSSAEPVDRIA